MTLRAFIDESASENGLFVLAGHIATEQQWVQFEREWIPLNKKFVKLSKNNIYRFKMAEVANNPERMEGLPAFWRSIENNVIASISCTIDMSDLYKAKRRISVPGIRIDWGFLNNRYLFAFRALMDAFHSRRNELSSIFYEDSVIDFYFDNVVRDKKQIWDAWESYVRSRENYARARIGAKPRFEDDEEFIPLQAADLWAWWVRKWYEEGRPDKMSQPDFGGFRGNGIHPKIDFSKNEEDIVQDIKRAISEQAGDKHIIFDTGKWPR